MTGREHGAGGDRLDRDGLAPYREIRRRSRRYETVAFDAIHPDAGPVTLVVLPAGTSTDQPAAQEHSFLGRPEIGVVPVVETRATPAGLSVVVLATDGLRPLVARPELSFSIERSLRITYSLAALAKRLHAHGAVIGNISPDVLYLRDHRAIVIEGWGIGSATPMTGRFSAPEQRNGSAPTVSADLYSVVAVLFWLLHGRPPTEPLQILRPDLPHGVVQLLTTGLSTDPDERHQSADELIEHILTVASSLSDTPRPAREMRLAELAREVRLAREAGLADLKRSAERDHHLSARDSSVERLLGLVQARYRAALELGLTPDLRALIASIEPDRLAALVGDRQIPELLEQLGLNPPGTPEGAGITGSSSTADHVDCSVFADRRLLRGAEQIVQVWTHTRDDATEVANLATDVDAQAGRRAVRSLAFPVERGARLTFALTVTGCSVSQNETVVWDGRPTTAQFVVTAPADLEGPVIATVSVRYEDVPVGHIVFSFSVADETGVPEWRRRVGDEAHRFRRAFISYATEDRVEVLKRVQVLNALGIEHFQDIDIEPGDRWARRIYEEIDVCDLFLLFWSSYAKASTWVRRESAHALSCERSDPQGLPDIRPIVVEGPPSPAPWPELSALQFADRLLDSILANNVTRPAPTAPRPSAD